MENNEETLLVKRYQNRKLYDTSTGKYIKLGKLLDFVLEGTDFKVMDVQSKDDITAEILFKALVSYQIKYHKQPDIQAIKNMITKSMYSWRESVVHKVAVDQEAINALSQVAETN